MSKAISAVLADSAVSAGEPQLPLAQLRVEIDAVDDQILAMLERRLDLARRVGHAKSGQASPFLNLKPDREDHVLRRLIARAEPGTKRLALAIWREVMAAGLAVQGQLAVLVWPGSGMTQGLDLARRRFGSAANYQLADTPQAALAAAARDNVVALLALDPRQPWWIELATGCENLWIFDALSHPRSAPEPMALAVGRIDPAALARGQVLSAERTIAASSDATRPALAAAHGWRLELADEASSTPICRADRERGLIGRAPLSSGLSSGVV